MKKLAFIFMLFLSCFSLGSEYMSDKLISSARAREMIESEQNVVVIDVRPRTEFLVENVRGTNNLWRTEIESGYGIRVSREEMEEVLRGIGVSNDTHIILVGNNLDEYRLWWILDLYNGSKNVKIVDGGISTFKAAGISSIPQRARGNFKFPAGLNNDILADFDYVKSNLKSTSHIILDTRSVAEHQGKIVRIGAELPGALPSKYFVEFNKAMNEDGTMKSYDQLVELYTKNGVTADKIIITYSHSGVRSAFSVFVLKELLGYPEVKNYEGSWIDWVKNACSNSVSCYITP